MFTIVYLVDENNGRSSHGFLLVYETHKFVNIFHIFAIIYLITRQSFIRNRRLDDALKKIRMGCIVYTERCYPHNDDEYTQRHLV